MNQGTGASGPVLFWATLGIVLGAPLVWGGNRPPPLMVLELAGLAAVLILAWKGEVPSLSRPLRAGLAILVAFPLLQLIPLPASWWAALPGHGPYAAALESAAAGDGWRSITLHRHATEYAWLALLPPVAVFLAVQALDRREVRAIVLAFGALVCGEALLGVMQVGASKDSLVVLGNPWGGGLATGTFINKNHLAGFLAMGLPVLVALWAGEVQPREGDPRRPSDRRVADVQLARRMGWTVLIVVVLAALALTRSRAGIACGLAAFAAAATGFAWSGGSKASRAALAAVAGGAILLATYAGLTPVMERFEARDLAASYENRLRIAAAAMKGGLDFLPLGSGLGTFADVFRRYQPEGIVGYVDHAHNDYAEAFLELGVAGIAVVGLFALAYGTRWREIGLRPQGHPWRTLQAAAGLSVLALGMHGLFDFNFHIPGNAVCFAFLAGIFFKKSRRVEPAGAQAPGA